MIPRFIYLLLTLFFAVSLAAQQDSLSVFCIDPMKQSVEPVKAKGCGLIVENTFLLKDGIYCTIADEQIPYFGNNNDNLWAHIKAFTCDETHRQIERQRGQIQLWISASGAVDSVKAIHFNSAILAQSIETHFQQMSDWTPGTCAGQPIPYIAAIIVTFAPFAD